MSKAWDELARRHPQLRVRPATLLRRECMLHCRITSHHLRIPLSYAQCVRMQPTAAKPDFDHISLPALQVFMCVVVRCMGVSSPHC